MQRMLSGERLGIVLPIDCSELVEPCPESMTSSKVIKWNADALGVFKRNVENLLAVSISQS
jgi:hypothetical protein